MQESVDDVLWCAFRTIMYRRSVGHDVTIRQEVAKSVDQLSDLARAVFRLDVQIEKTFDPATEDATAPTPPLTTAESLAWAVLLDNQPAHALADYLQDQGIIPAPRETARDLIERLMGYAHHKRMNAANGKYRGTAMDNHAWGVVEGLLAELRTNLKDGDDIDQWK